MKATSNDVTKIVEDLIGANQLERYKMRFGVGLFKADNGALIRIPLKDTNGKLEDIIDLTTNPDGFVHPGLALYYIMTAWSEGINNTAWKESLRRIRHMKF
jgi:hypothetical protein